MNSVGCTGVWVLVGRGHTVAGSSNSWAPVSWVPFPLHVSRRGGQAKSSVGWVGPQAVTALGDPHVKLQREARGSGSLSDAL